MAFTAAGGCGIPTPRLGRKGQDIMPFEPIETQEELDKIVGARLAREREKYADYDQLKATAEEASEAIAERDELRGQLTESRRESIATAAGIPVELVVGDTEDDMRAHADRIKALVNAKAQAAAAEAPPAAQQMPNGPIVPSVGTTPTPPVNPLAELFG